MGHAGSTYTEWFILPPRVEEPFSHSASHLSFSPRYTRTLCWTSSLSSTVRHNLHIKRHSPQKPGASVAGRWVCIYYARLMSNQSIKDNSTCIRFVGHLIICLPGNAAVCRYLPYANSVVSAISGEYTENNKCRISFSHQNSVQSFSPRDAILGKHSSPHCLLSTATYSIPPLLLPLALQLILAEYQKRMAASYAEGIILIPDSRLDCAQSSARSSHGVESHRSLWSAVSSTTPWRTSRGRNARPTTNLLLKMSPVAQLEAVAWSSFLFKTYDIRVYMESWTSVWRESKTLFSDKCVHVSAWNLKSISPLLIFLLVYRIGSKVVKSSS